ncbi:MAG: hypothetical protein EOP13_31955 [Pseudomonas sp.]|nr:MAG: hypothetical protein EOP13_31955 [Pseudomonas sp.]
MNILSRSVWIGFHRSEHECRRRCASAGGSDRNRRAGLALPVGLKLPVRSSAIPWRVPLLLATVVMVVTIVLTAAMGMALGWSMAVSLLIGAVLAPTDPVLASEVQVSHG